MKDSDSYNGCVLCIGACWVRVANRSVMGSYWIRIANRFTIGFNYMSLYMRFVLPIGLQWMFLWDRFVLQVGLYCEIVADLINMNLHSDFDRKGLALQILM